MHSLFKVCKKKNDEINKNKNKKNDDDINKEKLQREHVNLNNS